ncbi:preprotein translocase subunit SecE [Marinimicrobium alkaliphilum]|uniref:preprotein translocase subunit SecE n=1 Tax=Marinimicrobium alkaliphilum TaxID=2202654 RepID=UPI000DBA1590|nr:preprotein translocase subunit SecE [Marinimicrobium alkaliphilum]
MNTKVEQKEYRLDALKWLLVVGLIIAGVVGNSHYSAEPLLYRVFALLGVAAVAGLVAYQTAKGAGAWHLIRGAFVEVRKVVWPSRQETNQTTLIVVVVVFITAIILWMLDALFGWVASLIIG